MTRTWVCCLLLAFALPGSAAEPSTFRFSKKIDQGSVQEESILAVVFDSDVYAATRLGFPDLRIFDAHDAEVPFLMEKVTEPRTRVVRTACGSEAVSLREQDDGLDVIVRLDARAPAADGLNIVTPLTDFERRVSVFGSNDGIEWTPLVSGGLVFDYSRYMDISNHEIRLPENDYRQFRVSIAGIADTRESPFLDLTRTYRDGGETERVERTVRQRRPFRIDRIEFWHENSEKVFQYDRKVDYDVADFHVEEDAARKQTVIRITTRREPLTEFTLKTSSRNFSRAAEVQTPVTHGVRTEWVGVGRGTVSLVDFGGYRKQALGLSFPERRETDYRIVIHNKDNPPLAITGVQPRGNVYQAVFLADENNTYRLGYGSEEIDRPEYDAAVVLTPLRQGRTPSEGRLGPEVGNPAAGEFPAFTLQRLLNNGLFLGASAVVLVVVLGWALFRAARRINEIPKE